MKLLTQVKNNHISAIAIGIVYLWFGILKFFTGNSPAEELAINTIDILTLSLIPSNVSILLLAIWETFIGVCFLLNLYNKKIIIGALVHLVFTFSPFLFFPNQSFDGSIFTLTLVGQYIIKNVVVISSLITLYKLRTNMSEVC